MMFPLRLLLAVLLLTLSAPGAPSPASFDAKAARGEPVSVVFFGGSLTFGANASDPGTTSYRGLMMRRLREKYPRTPIDFHDAAIGGTGSQLGLFRIERDVLRHKPDLVFLDFTVNDGSEETDMPSLAAYERIVRELLRHDAAVLPVILLFRWHAQKPDVTPPRHAAHLKLAAAYGLPAADVCTFVQEKVSAGTDPDDLWNLGDGAHPGDEGYRLFFEAVNRRFETAVRENKPSIIPAATVFPDLYPKRVRHLLKDDLPAGWERAKTWRTSMWFDGLSSRWMDDVAVVSAKNPRPLEIAFEGSMVGIFGERNGFTPPIRVWIDGQPIAPPKAKPGEFLWTLDTTRFAPAKKGSGNLFLWQPLARDLPDGKHTLRIEPVFDGAGPEAELRIESVCSAGR